MLYSLITIFIYIKFYLKVLGFDMIRDYIFSKQIKKSMVLRKIDDVLKQKKLELEIMISNYWEWKILYIGKIDIVKWWIN